MKRIRQWLLNLLFQQHEPTPEPTPKQEEEKIEVVSRQPMNGRTKQLIAKGVEKFFNDHYDLRFNILKRCEEFRPLASEKAPGFAKKAPGFAKKAPGFEQKAPGFGGNYSVSISISSVRSTMSIVPLPSTSAPCS